ncbi:MAG: FtsW/RodA/SpoVE family cell cycle protein [Bacteroidales bacterium]|nr:FtsW/RodA/SpoVE family cell cycle protein [Bacteroidales bacterium]
MNKIFEYLKGDRAIWLVVIFLSFISIVEVYSSTSMLAHKFQQGNTAYYAIKHLGFMLMGFGCMFFFCKFTHKTLPKVAFGFLVVSCVILLLTLITGESTNEAKRWFTIPLLGISFQPSDMAKMSLMIYLADVLSVPQQSPGDKRNTFFKCVGAIGAVCALILPANFSTAMLVGISALSVLVVARIPFKWIAFVILLAVAMFFLYVGFVKITGSNSRIGTWTKRMETFFQEGDRQADFQSKQSKIAISIGGILGKGPGNSDQRNALPHPYSDFIFSIVAEEFGIGGCLLVIAAYLIFFFRCIMIVKNHDRPFGAYLVVGLALNVVLQALANILVATGIMPVTGQPLPFVSMGGSSMLFTSMSVGIILNVSRYSGKHEEISEIEEDQDVEEIVDYPFMAG